MAEVPGVSAAEAQLFRTAIPILKRVKKAYRDHHYKEFSKTLGRHERELSELKSLIGKAGNEKVLKGNDMTSILARLSIGEDRLRKWLDKVDPDNKKSRRPLKDRLSRGLEDKKKLDDLMKEFNGVKCELDDIISRHHTRLSENAGESRGSPSVRDIGIPIRGRTDSVLSESNTSYTLTGDVSSGGGSSVSERLEAPQLPFTIPQVPKTRIIKGNTTKRGASMFNAPFGGMDLWDGVPIIQIEGNVAEDESLMVNYRQDDQSVALIKELHETRL